jgi:hypothetical protein
VLAREGDLIEPDLLVDLLRRFFALEHAFLLLDQIAHVAINQLVHRRAIRLPLERLQMNLVRLLL